VSLFINHVSNKSCRKFKTAVILIQCIYESEVTVSEKDLLFVERFLKQNGPLPFDLVITWVQFKIHLGHLEYVKELVAGFLESFNARIKKYVLFEKKESTHLRNLI